MRLDKRPFIKLGKFDVKYRNNKVYVENKSGKNGFLVVKKLYKHNKKDKRVVFIGNVINGDAPVVKIINRRRTVMFEFDFNTQNIISTDILKYYLVAIYIPKECKFEIEKFEYDEQIENLKQELVNELKNDTLLITPGYPSESNKYNTAFVHTRVKEYYANGLPVDVLVINSLAGISTYTFEEIRVTRANYHFLREVLSQKKYKRILIHFFDCNYGNVFDAVDLTATSLYFYAHGAELLYKESAKYAGSYFKKMENQSVDSPDTFKLRDYYVKKYNNFPNVKWIFVSGFLKESAERLHNLKFNNYEIIPCYIDEKMYIYSEKNEDVQKKIFVLRKFSNDSCYALDIDVRAILELSRRECFKSLTFDIYGNGEMFDIITAPIKQFDNVNFHREFLTHEEIREIHNTHGIGLFASRFDTQGVSLCEAGASGCAIVSSKIPVIKSYIDENLNVLCDVEEFEQYADVIERLATDSYEFKRVSKSISESIREKFSYKQTINKELEMFANEVEPSFLIKKVKTQPILTVIVPSYNVEKYLWNGVISIINHPNAHKLEVLIIDDGSKDCTAKIGKKLEDFTEKAGGKIVRLISKENGGHGSTINVGIKEARGKYIKIVDGDDTLDSVQFCKLIDILEKESSDIVLSKYMEDFSVWNALVEKDTYPFMIPGKQYKFEDLCFEGYGFDEWGPILACSAYKTEFIRKADFVLSEKCFYVDVELNTFISLACDTISYYPLSIYRYLLGRVGQSVSKAAYMRNYKNHEHVTMRVIKSLYDKANELTESRKKYICDKIILKMITTQYIVCVEFYNKSGPFRSFEKRLKEYPELYNYPAIATRAIKFHRRTRGCFIFLNSFLVSVKKHFMKIFGFLYK